MVAVLVLLEALAHQDKVMLVVQEVILLLTMVAEAVELILLSQAVVLQHLHRLVVVAVHLFSMVLDLNLILLQKLVVLVVVEQETDKAELREPALLVTLEDTLL